MTAARDLPWNCCENSSDVCSFCLYVKCLQSPTFIVLHQFLTSARFELGLSGLKVTALTTSPSALQFSRTWPSIGTKISRGNYSRGCLSNHSVPLKSAEGMSTGSFQSRTFDICNCRLNHRTTIKRLGRFYQYKKSCITAKQSSFSSPPTQCLNLTLSNF